MNTLRAFILSLAFLTAGIACAQENPAPARAAIPGDASAAKPQSEMEKWIATTDAQWQAAFKRDVTDMRETELNKLKLQYITILEDGIGKASKASDLDGAVALRSEQKRFGDTQFFPEQDDADTAPSVKQIRAVIRTQLAKLEKDNATRAKALHARYDQMLAQTQAQLTRRQRFDDALLVKAKRDEVDAAWITPAVVAALEKSAPPAAPVTPAPAKTAMAKTTTAKTTKTGEDLAQFLEGTLWTWGTDLLNPGSRLRFLKDRTAMVNNDSPRGWTAVDADTVILDIGAKLKFSRDRTRYEGVMDTGAVRVGKRLKELK